MKLFFRGGKVQFEEINLQQHYDKVVKFRKDLFQVSFGDSSNFGEEEYLNWLEEKIKGYL